MSFVVNTGNDEPVDDDAEFEFDAELADQPEPWRSVAALAELSADDAAATAQRLAAAWLATEASATPDPADTELIASIHAEGGHVAFVSFLRAFDGDAATLGAVLATAALLEAEEREIRRTTKYRRKDIRSTEEAISNAVLDGDLPAARGLAIDALKNLNGSLAGFKAFDNKAMRSALRAAERLRHLTEELLAELTSQ